MKIIFLNIESTFYGIKTMLATSGIPQKLNEDNKKFFDWITIGIIRNICKNRDIKIVAYTRFSYDYSLDEIKSYFDLPICKILSSLGAVSTSSGFSLDLSEPFISLVTQWLNQNQEKPIKDFVILDYDNEVPFDFYSKSIFIDALEGFKYHDYKKMCAILKIKSS